MTNIRRVRNRRRAEAERLQNRYNTIMSGIALFALAIAPLVFHMARIDFVSPAITNTTTADTGAMSDVFTYYKMLIYYSLSIILIIIFSARLLTTEVNDFKLTRYDAALASLCALLLLSCIISEYRHIAIQGFIYMLDGTAAHICYCVLFFFGYHVFSKSRLKHWFIVPLFISGIINALVSVLNFVGVNMIDTAIIKLILGVPAGAVATNAKAFSSTFGNINYLSGFGGVLFAIFFTRLLFSPQISLPDENSANRAKSLSPRIDRTALKHTIISLSMVAVAFSIIVTSTSSSGFFVFSVMTPIIIIFAFLCGGVVRKTILAASALFICALILLPLAAINATVYEETFGMFGSFAANMGGDVNGDVPQNGKQSVYMQQANYAFSLDAPQLGSRYAPQLDSQYEQLAAAPAAPAAPVALATQATPATPATLAAPAASALPVSLNSSSDSASDSASAAAAASYSTDFDLPASFPQPGISPGTGRLYIWKDTLRLILRKPLTGYGMDTLAYTFPQNDLNKIAGIGSYDIYVTKPHNAFIAYAYGAGIPALIAFLLLNIFAAAAFLRYFIANKGPGSTPDIMIMCALLGWVAYLAQAFVNDDLISTAPFWWTLLGIGLGMINAAAGSTAKKDAAATSGAVLKSTSKAIVGPALKKAPTR